MTASLGSEDKTVKWPHVGYATQIGWAWLSREDALAQRNGESGTLLYDVLRARLLALNPGWLEDDDAGQIVDRIESVRSGIEGNAEILAWLRGERTWVDQRERRARNVRVVDFEHPQRNTLHVTEEWQYRNGKHTNRADVVFLVNRIPVAIVEAKSAKVSQAIANAIDQPAVGDERRVELDAEFAEPEV